MMKMKTLPLSLFVFVTVFLLSCAFPRDTGNDGPRSLVDSKTKEKYLQRKKPPHNIPGPKLSPKEFNPPYLTAGYEPEEKTKNYATYIPEKERKLSKLMKSKKNGDFALLNKAKDEKGVQERKHISAAIKRKANGEGRVLYDFGD